MRHEEVLQTGVTESGHPLELLVNDLKQYAYCPRVVYYHYVLPVDRKVTYKMVRGKVAQEEMQRLESRRKLKRYRLDSGTRTFDVWIRSTQLGLSGKLDMLIETASEGFPVDFKWTKGGVQRNHVLQLVGYSLLVEEHLSKPVSTAFVYLVARNDVVPCAVTEALKRECVLTLEEIRKMIREERFPDAPRQRGKCADCEYRNYCKDVW